MPAPDRTSLLNSARNAAQRKLQSPGDETKGIWSSMLDNAATSKRLTEKNVVVLGV